MVRGSSSCNDSTIFRILTCWVVLAGRPFLKAIQSPFQSFLDAAMILGSMWGGWVGGDQRRLSMGAAAHGWGSPILSSPMTLTPVATRVILTLPLPPQPLPSSESFPSGHLVMLSAKLSSPCLLHPCWWRWLWWRARAHGGILSRAVVAVRPAEQRWQPASGGCSLASLRSQPGMTPPAHGEQKPG